MTDKIENCENCGQLIGKLEIGHMYRDHILCDECNRRLRKQDDSKKSNIKPDYEVNNFVQSAQSEKKQKWNGFCIAAFVISLLNLPGPEMEMSPDAKTLLYIVGFMFFVLSIVFAYIGLSQIGENPTMRGMGLGKAAIIISIATFVIIFMTHF
jgi:hypothetical protein